MKTVPKAVKSNLDINSRNLQKKYKKVIPSHTPKADDKVTKLAIYSL
jgi:hypothetical protein